MDSIVKQNESKDVLRELGISLPCDPNTVIKNAKKELEKKQDKRDITAKGDLFQAISLSEFESGFLLATNVSEPYKTFGIQMLRDLQKEYNCTTVSEKATVELATLSYIRMLDLERRLNRYIYDSNMNNADLILFGLLSKDLDRAIRQYLSSLQALKIMKQPQLQVNIKTETAIVGQNQVIQEQHG